MSFEIINGHNLHFWALGKKGNNDRNAGKVGEFHESKYVRRPNMIMFPQYCEMRYICIGFHSKVLFWEFECYQFFREINGVVSVYLIIKKINFTGIELVQLFLHLKYFFSSRFHPAVFDHWSSTTSDCICCGYSTPVYMRTMSSSDGGQLQWFAAGRACSGFL